VLAIFWRSTPFARRWKAPMPPILSASRTRLDPCDRQFAQARRRLAYERHQSIAAFANRFSTSNSCRDSFIAEQVLNWSGLPVVHLRPTYFLEWLLYPWQLPYLRQGILRMPVGKGRHSPIAADDQGRVIAALLKSPDGHIGKTIPISGPVEMDHEQIAAELTDALGRKIVFQEIPIDEYCRSLEAMGVPPYIVQHLGGAMDDYQHGHMSGADNNVEKLTGRRSMTIGEFARAHADVLNAKPDND